MNISVEVSSVYDLDCVELGKLTPIQAGGLLYTLYMESGVQVEGGVGSTVKEFHIKVLVNNKVAGISSISLKELHLEGEVRLIAYLHSLRILSDYRGLGIYRILRERAKKVTEAASVYATYIAVHESNKRMQQKLKDDRDIFEFHHAGDVGVLNILPSVWGARAKSGLQIRRAEAADFPFLCDFIGENAGKYALAASLSLKQIDSTMRDLPGYSCESYLLAFDGEEIVACLGTWNQGEFRKCEILEMDAEYRVTKLLYNSTFGLLTNNRLPGVGGMLNPLFSTHFYIKGGYENVALDLLVEGRKLKYYSKNQYLSLNCPAGELYYEDLLSVSATSFMLKIYSDRRIDDPVYFSDALL